MPQSPTAYRESLPRKHIMQSLTAPSESRELQPPEVLVELHRSYLGATSDVRRLEVILGMRPRLMALAVELQPPQLLRLLEALLHYAGRDGFSPRVGAAELLREIWRGLPDRMLDLLFHGFTLSLLERCPSPGARESGVLWEAIEGGFDTAGAPARERLCRELTVREVERCLRPEERPGLWRRLAAPPAPNFDILRLVGRYAPVDLWPWLTRDLWRLYNLDTESILSLTMTEVLTLRRTEAGTRYRLSHVASNQTNPNAAWFRRSSNGRHECWTPCWDLAQQMLHRTLTEARPDHLGDAAPTFFAWLEGLVVLPEEELEAVVWPLAGWASPPVLRVLERWKAGPTAWERYVGAPPYSRKFRRMASLAAAEVRDALGALGREMAPSAAPPGNGRETAPAAQEGR